MEHNKKSMLDMDVHTTKAAQSTIKCTNSTSSINPIINKCIKCTNSNNQIINKCTNRIIKCTNLTKHYRTGSRCNRTSNPRCIGSKSTCRVKSCLRMKTCRPCRPPRLKTM